MYQILLDEVLMNEVDTEAKARSIARRYFARGFENVEIIPPEE